MEQNQQKKLAHHICRLIKVQDIIYPIGRTSKGNLGIRFAANSEDFDIMLDSIPLSTKDMLADDNNIELKRMLEKYLFEPAVSEIYKTKIMGEPIKPHQLSGATIETLKEVGADTTGLTPRKQRGRPKGSKGKK